MNITIRPEMEADLSQIAQVISEAFGQPDEGKLVERLRHTTGFIPDLSLVAVAGEQVIGHVLFSRITIETAAGGVETLALAPVSVAPGFQRKGIGSQLIEAGLERAKEMGFTSVIVLGHDDYYPKFGFRPAAEWQINSPFEVPSSNFMALELQENTLAGVQGTVHYPAEFFA